MSQKQKARQRKWLERILMGVVVAGFAVVIALYSQVFREIAEWISPTPTLYGTWIEEQEASFEKDRFTVSAAGISRAGRVLTSHYDVDGKSLSFTIGAQTYRFERLNEQWTRMVLVSQPHYRPIYRLLGEGEKE